MPEIAYDRIAKTLFSVFLFKTNIDVMKIAFVVLADHSLEH